MILIQPLHNIQCFLCRKSKSLVGISLKLCQVIKSRGSSCFPAFFHRCHRQNTVSRRCLYSLHTVLMKRTGTSAFFILPGPTVSSGTDGKTIIFLWFKIPYFLFSGCNHSQGGRLHPSTGQLGIILTGQRSGRIDSYQPVCFCARYCRIVQRIVISSVS